MLQIFSQQVNSRMFFILEAICLKIFTPSVVSVLYLSL